MSEQTLLMISQDGSSVYNKNKLFIFNFFKLLQGNKFV